MPIIEIAEQNINHMRDLARDIGDAMTDIGVPNAFSALLDWEQIIEDPAYIALLQQSVEEHLRTVETLRDKVALLRDLGDNKTMTLRMLYTGMGDAMLNDVVRMDYLPDWLYAAPYVSSCRFNRRHAAIGSSKNEVTASAFVQALHEAMRRDNRKLDGTHERFYPQTPVWAAGSQEMTRRAITGISLSEGLVMIQTHNLDRA